MTRCPVFQVLLVGLCVISDVYAVGCPHVHSKREYHGPGRVPFTINCRNFDSDIRYRWSKSVPYGDANPPVFNTTNITVYSSYILFTGFGLEEEGSYICIYLPLIWHIEDDWFTLRSIKIQPGTPLTYDRFYVGNELSYVKVNCTMNGEVEGDDIAYRWETPDGTPIDTADPERLYVDTTGALHFTPIKFSDAGIGGTKYYVCYVYSEKMGGGQYGSPVSAIIQEYDRDNVIRGPPYLVYRNGNVTVALGKTVILECVFHIHVSYQQTTYSWEIRYTKNITKTDGKYEVLGFGRRLQIKNAHFNDTGDYICRANSTWGFNHEDYNGRNNSFRVQVVCP